MKYIYTHSNVYAKLSTCYRCRIHDQTDMKAMVYDPSGNVKKKNDSLSGMSKREWNC